MRKIREEWKVEIENLQKIERASANKVCQIRQYRLITPLFGGGVEAGIVDETNPIRETSIRGQLRFWWRATRGTGDVKDVKKREDEIFGGGGENASQSKVFVKVETINHGSLMSIFDVRRERRVRPIRGYEAIAYAAFPLQPSREQTEQQLNKVLSGVKFKLHISFPEEIRCDIEAALWAWETFGGVGARTRRGFGAIELLSVEENGVGKEVKKYSKNMAESQIRDDLRKFVKSNHRDQRIPHLSPETKFKVLVAKDAEDAWRIAIQKLKDFRQFRIDRRTGRRSPFGKSQWCEPDAIRNIVRGRRVNNLVEKFPRAAFGLPILFHFPQDGTIPDVALKPKDYERVASPLILKPIPCEDGAVAVAILLERELFPNGLVIEYEDKDKKIVNKNVKANLSANEAIILTKGGLTVLRNKTDVIEAFFDFF
ncbi:MAG: type III-B CRISPR module RAMP protein Cmr1 [Acidobacteriota bacterium]|nr:type III-B CRISPR module RAMP protein Cmr1 [Acidobacteriota bacterium]